MKNSFGNNLTLTLFGESHGKAIGAVLDGLAAGISVDEQFISSQLDLRRSVASLSTPRREADEFEILSGVYEGKTTGTPLCIVIKNSDTRSADYKKTATLARPSHADYTAECKYGGFQDFRGGGHFSGRITAALVAAGAIIISALKEKGIYIGSHISRLGGIADREFCNFTADIADLSKMPFAVLDEIAGEKMQQAILDAKKQGDSIGGVLQTAIYGVPAGVGEPWFDTLEGTLSHALFSIPAVKGVEFGAGFGFADMHGSTANDPFVIENGEVKTATNNSGGINGGISNGMPIVFSCAMRPTPTIMREQQTIDIKTKTPALLQSKGRHDPCIVHRARVVVDSVAALCIADALVTKYGTDWLGAK